jgi:hypothetical protein
VTLAALLIMGGSALVVVTVFERVAGLHSLETRAAVERFLAEPPADELGLDVPGVLNILRVLCMVAAGCATAAAILGYQVLRRSRSARLALTVLAVPLFVTGLVTGGFLAAVVAASALMLWVQPSRAWFSGDPAPTAPAPRTGPDPRTGTDPRTGPDPQRPAGQDARPPAYLPLLETDPTVRPSAVAWACALTWVCAGLTALVTGLSLALLAASPDLVFEELHRQNPDLAGQGLSDDTLRTATLVVGGVVVVWSLLAVGLAALAFRGVEWARVALVVSASGAALLLLVATVGQVLLLLPLAASVVTLALLVRPDVRAWYDHRAPGRAPDRAP